MARLPRLTAVGYPHHVIQRGNNRQLIFVDPQDRQRFLDRLRELAAEYKVAVHAYVLMSNHVHLLLTPDTADGVPRLMQALGRAYVRYFNLRHGRTGTLWEGRYRSTLIEAERHLLACMAYIDLNPVRAGMVAQPEEYAWSSHGALAGLRTEPWLSPPPLYWQLGNTPFARERAYVDLVRAGLSSNQLDALRRASQGGWALGDADFVAELQQRVERRVSPARAGRPFKSA